MADDVGTLDLLFGGDLMLGRGVNKVIHEKGPAYPLETLHTITHAADLFFVNLECAISGLEKKFEGAPKVFYFRADPSAIETMTGAGVNAVSLANNHALDAAEIGLKNTLQHLKENGIESAGAGLGLESARHPARLDAGELSVGLLSVCDHQADFAAEEDQPGIYYLDLRSGDHDALLQDVRKLAATVDLVVVALHWQPNWAPRVEPVYRNLAAELVSSGADIIWGHSPHHFQGVEWIDDAVVMYASGDLVDDYAIDERYRNDLQLLFEIRFTAGRPSRVRALPLRLHYARTELAEGEDRRWIEIRFNEMCADVGSRVESEGDWLRVHRG